MKKILSLFLSALLVFMLSNALAVNVSYEEGRVTISTESSGFFEIWLDGVSTGYWVGTGHPSYTLQTKLEDGEHSVRLYSADFGIETTKFWVGKKPEESEQPAPTDAPVIPDATETPTIPDVTNQPSETEQVNPDVTNKQDPQTKETPAIYPNHTESAKELKQVEVLVEPTCNKDGKASDNSVIPALGHCYGMNSKNNYEVRYQCVRCGRTLTANLYGKVENRLGTILRDENGAVLNYQGYDKKDDTSLYTIQVEKSTGIALLYLDYQVIAQLIREGYQRLAFINGNAELVITLKNIGAKWFNTADVINTYIFQTNAAAKQGTTVVISALTDKEQVFANLFDGVTLNGAPIEKNGTY